MNSREREALDRHITGNYGEDQFPDDGEYCDAHASVTDDEYTLGDPWADREAAAKDCPDCQRIRSLGEPPRGEVRGRRVIAGTELRKEREDAGVSASAVARGMGVSPQYVSKLERYEFVTGDTLAMYRAAIEGEVALREGRKPMKNVPLACPICGQDTDAEPSHPVSLMRHLMKKHPEREVLVRSSLPGGPGTDYRSIIASSGGRSGWLVDERKGSFSVMFTDYPYSIMTIPGATYTFEPKNLVPTPEGVK